MIPKITKAVIPVAGLGTRMLPATKAIPKELLPVFNRPIIEHVVEEAVAGGIKEVILVTRSGKQAIENHFDANYELEHRLEKKGKDIILGKVKNIVPEEIKMMSIRQGDALGLGHAVLSAKPLLNEEPFVVLLPDVILLDKVSRSRHFSFKKMVEAWEGTGWGQIMVERVDPELVENYGIVDLYNHINSFESASIKALVEKPSPANSPTNLAVLGRYALPYSVIKILETTGVGVGGEIQLTDALDQLLKLDGLNAFETDAKVFDCGNKEGFLGANLALGMRDLGTRKYLQKIIDAEEWH